MTTPNDVQNQINAVPWTNKAGLVTGATMFSLLTAIVGLFALYGSLSGTNVWTGTNTFNGPVNFNGTVTGISSGLIAGTSPITGTCTNNYVLYDNSSTLGCESFSTLISQNEDASGRFNISPNNLIHWRAAVSKVKQGLGRGKLLVISDSTGAGAGAGSGGSYDTTGAYPYNWPTLLSKQLSSFVATNDNTVFGDQNIVGSGQQSSYNTYDTRVTLGGSWTIATGIGGLGANFFNATGSGTLAFTSSGLTDSATIWYTTSGGLGTFTTNFDGGSSLGTINQGTGGTTFTSTTYSTTSGNHTYNVVWASGNVYISGIVAYLSTVPAIDIYHSAWFGAYASNFNISSSPWMPIPAIQTLAPDLTIIALTINDSNNGTSLAAYQTNMQAIITAAKVSGDCLLVAGAPSNTSQATNGTLAGFLAVDRALALSNNCGFIDIPTRWVSYAVTNPVIAYYDSLHPAKQGYSDIATAVAEVLGAP